MSQQQEHLKHEIDEILSNYRIPFEDRTLVLEKIESSLGEMISEERQAVTDEIDKVKTEIGIERDHVRSEVAKMRDMAMHSVDDMESQVDEAYKRGYDEGHNDGYFEGMGQVTPVQPTGIQTAVALGFVGMGLMMIARDMLKNTSLMGLLFKGGKKIFS